MFFDFGKKKKKSVRKVKRPPARLIKMCKKYRIKVTKRVGKKKIYKSVTVLKRLLKNKKKKHSKRSKRSKHSKKHMKKRVKHVRKSLH